MAAKKYTKEEETALLEGIRNGTLKIQPCNDQGKATSEKQQPLWSSMRDMMVRLQCCITVK